MIREVTVAMLHELGYESLTAADGREALRIFREQGEKIGLVLLDQIMPGMDGVQVFKELRFIRPDITVLLASGYSELEMAERFKGLGLSGFIQKPYNLEQLADEIRRTDKVT
jgi:DNA-binding NtrC family response regulator